MAAYLALLCFAYLDAELVLCVVENWVVMKVYKKGITLAELKAEKMESYMVAKRGITRVGYLVARLAALKAFSLVAY